MPCEWTPDDAGYVSMREMAANVACPIPPDLRGFALSSVILDEHGHVLDGDRDPKGMNGCDHRDTPEWRAAHRRLGKAKEAVVAETKSVPEERPEAAATTATIGVDAAVAQVKSLAPEGASAGLLIGGAAVLAVIGAAVKFGPTMLKNRAEAAEREHEREMKRLELEEQKARQNDDQHQKCSVERAALEAKVTAVESSLSGVTSRLVTVESAVKAAGEKTDGMGNLNPDALDENFAALSKRITKLETAAKKKGGK